MKAVQIGNAGHAFYAHNGLKHHGIELVGISSGSYGNELEGIAETHKYLIGRGFHTELYDSYIDMLDREKPDIAIVNPFYNDNGRVALAALERGIHVFCEKPIATDFETLSRLKNLADLGNAVLAGMFDARYMRGFRTVKKVIDEGRIGKIRLMDSRKSYKLGKRPLHYLSREYYCGIIPWVSIHAIDWMKWLSGEAYTSVSALHSALDNGGNGDMDIISSAQFKMTGDVIATVTADMYRPESAKTHGDDRVRVVGTNGIVELMHGEVTLINSDGEQKLKLEPAGDLFEAFLERARGIENDLTAQSSIESTEWALRADLSARGM